MAVLLDLCDFYFTGDDYRYRFEPNARQRFIDLIRERFNTGVPYKGRVLKWDTIIEQKTGALGGYLTGKRPSLDLIEPAPRLERFDKRELRSKILHMSYSQAKQLGISKNTLHYMRKNATNCGSFRVYAKVYERLNSTVAP